MLHKTPQKQRITYTYRFQTPEGTTESIVIRPGEAGVTELDIQQLHRADDRDVYHNLKAINPNMSLTEREKEELQKRKTEFEAQFTADYIAQNGFKPEPSELQEALKKTFPTDWTWSLDSCGQRDYGNLCAEQNVEETVIHGTRVTPQVVRMREVIAGLSQKHWEVYVLVYIKGAKQTEASAALHITPARVSQLMKEIRKALASDEILKKMCR